MDASIKNNIFKLYLYQIFRGMFFCVPIIVIFWQENWLSLTEVMLLQSFYSIIVVWLEIPTWYMADVLGRKKTLLYSVISWFFAFSIYSFGFNFYHFLFAEVFFALSTSFASWTLSAFFYDTLIDLWKEKEYKKLRWNVLFYWMSALAFSSVIWWILASYDLRYAIYASIPFFILLVPLTLSMVEPKWHREIIKKWYMRELFLSIKNNFINSKKLKWIIIYSSVIYAFNQVSLWLYQPYFEILWIDIIYFWLIFASFQLVAAFSSKYAYKLEEFLWEKYSLIMLIFLVSLSYLLMSNFVLLFSFSFAFIQQFVRWFKNTIITDYINKLTTSNIRATILSIESFLSKLLYASIIPFIWWYADVYTLLEALFLLWVTSLISWVIIVYMLHKFKI